MKRKHFPTRGHAIRELIIDRIEAVEEFDRTVNVERVADLVLDHTAEGYAVTVPREEFWAIVVRNSTSA